MRGAPLEPRRTDEKAMAALLLGFISLGGGPLAGIPAIVLGALARRDIDRAGGTIRGRTLATTGIVSGLLGTGTGAVLVLYLVHALFAGPVTAELSPRDPPVASVNAEPPSFATASTIAPRPLPERVFAPRRHR